MGSVFGKETVKEPPFEVLLQRPTTTSVVRRRSGDDGAKTTSTTSYEVRKYGERFAASVTWTPTGPDDNSTPFRTLAGYIGVFGTAQNEGSKGISMTAPVVMEEEEEEESGNGKNKNKKPESIAMTAPVVMENNNDNNNNNDDSDGNNYAKRKKMMFMLPAEYDTMSKIPKPTNPNVRIEELPSEVGAVHRYNGPFNEDVNREKGRELVAQLVSDGVMMMMGGGIIAEEENALVDDVQFWGYNPPFTLPHFRRNEVWLKLNDDQVNYLLEKKFPEGGLPGGGGSSNNIKGRTMLSLGVCGLVVGAYAVGLLVKSRTQYRRL